MSELSEVRNPKAAPRTILRFRHLRLVKLGRLIKLQSLLSDFMPSGHHLFIMFLRTKNQMLKRNDHNCYLWEQGKVSHFATLIQQTSRKSLWNIFFGVEKSRWMGDEVLEGWLEGIGRCLHVTENLRHNLECVGKTEPTEFWLCLDHSYKMNRMKNATETTNSLQRGTRVEEEML